MTKICYVCFLCRLNDQLRDQLGVGDIFGLTLLVGNEQL